MNLKPMPIGTFEDGQEIKVYDHQAMLDYYPGHLLKVIISESEIKDIVGSILINAQCDSLPVKFVYQNTYGLNTILIGCIMMKSCSSEKEFGTSYIFFQTEQYITKEIKKEEHDKPSMIYCTKEYFDKQQTPIVSESTTPTITITRKK